MDNITEFLDLSFSLGKLEISTGDILLILIIFIGSKILYWSIKKVIERTQLSKRIKMDEGRMKAILQIFRYLLYVIVVIISLQIISENPFALITGTAAILVGIGLAIQNILNDFISGIVILLDGTIEEGDVVQIDSLGLEGKIKEIRLRTSVIETIDSISIVVPNSRFTSTNVINMSYNDRETRFSLDVGVAYGSDVNLVRKILIDCANQHGRVLKKKQSKVRFVDFGDSSLMFKLFFWTHHAFEIEEIQSDLRFKIESEFRKFNIEIPFPQRDIHLKQPIQEELTHLEHIKAE